MSHLDVLKEVKNYNTIGEFLNNFRPAPGLDKLLPGISTGIEHWDDLKNQRNHHQKIYFLLKSWLQGIRPPKQCRASIGGKICDKEAAKESSPCELHRCNFSVCFKVRFNGAKRFCPDHNCSNTGCESERFINSSFCSKHVCAKCLDRHSNPIKSAEPFACKQHTCTYANCDRMQVLNSTSRLCVNHACTECLVTNQSTVNEREKLSKNFCVNHKCIIKGCQHKRFVIL